MNYFQSFLLFVLVILTANCGGVNQQAINGLPDVDKTLLTSNNYKTWQYGQFYVHYPADGFTAGKTDEFKAALDVALENAKRTVGISTYDQTVHFIVFNDQEAMTAHVGNSLWYYTKPNDHLAYFVHKEDRAPYFTRTLFQLAAVDTWGYPRAEMLAFGGALFAKGVCQDITYFLDEVGASLFRSGNMMSLRAMFTGFGPAIEQAPVLSEIHAAALYQFVYDNFGQEKVIELWKQGTSRIEGVIYLSPGEVEKEIFGRWRNYTPTQEVDWEKIELEGC